jgi:hypothetical protein
LNFGHSLDAAIISNTESSPADGSINPETAQLLAIINDFLRSYAEAVKYQKNREKIYEITRDYIRGVYKDRSDIIQGLHQRINVKFSNSEDFAKITGLAFVSDFEMLGIKPSHRYAGPSFQIQNLRLVSGTGPEGNQLNQVIFSITQRTGVVNEDGQFKFFKPANDSDPDEMPKGGFEFMGACTLIFDLDSLQLKYAISKPIIDIEALEKEEVPKINMRRLQIQYDFQQDPGLSDYSLYFGSGHSNITEPFAFLHQH